MQEYKYLGDIACYRVKDYVEENPLGKLGALARTSPNNQAIAVAEGHRFYTISVGLRSFHMGDLSLGCDGDI